jgi:phosphatidylglycerophosphatase A
MERVCIYPKDVQLVTGKSERWGREIIKKIKTKFNKQDHQLVTIDEFCTYMGLSQQLVKEQLKN